MDEKIYGYPQELQHRGRLPSYVIFVFAIAAIAGFLAWIQTDDDVYLVGVAVMAASSAIGLGVLFARISELAKRITLIFLLFLSALLLIPVVSLLIPGDGETVRDLEMKTHAEFNRRVASRINRFFGDNKTSFNKLLHVLNQTENPADDVVGDILMNFVRQTGGIDNIGLLDSSGSMIFGYPIALKTRLKIDPRFKEGLHFFDLSRSVPIGLEGYSQIMSIKLIAPCNVERAGRFVFAVLDLQGLKQILGDLPGNIRYYLFDQENVEVFANTNRSVPEWMSGDGYVISGKDVVIQKTIPSVGWRMIAVYESDFVFRFSDERRRQLLWRLAIFVTAGFVLALAVVNYLIRAILNPITTLSNNAGAISSGELEREITENFQKLPKDEIGELTLSVDRMVGTLRLQTAQQASLNEELRRVKARLDVQLNAAHKIQQGMTPTEPLCMFGFEVDCELRLMEEVGGDHVDYFRIDDRCFGILLLDAAGKGISASFYTALARGIVESRIKRRETDLVELVESLNQQFLQLRDSKTRTIALLYAVIDTEQHTLAVVNAGFEQPRLIRNGLVETMNIRGRSLGMPRWLGQFETSTIQLETDDRVVFHSDGIVDIEGVFKEQLESRLPDDVQALVKTIAGSAAGNHDDAVICALMRRTSEVRSYTMPSIPDHEVPIIETVKKELSSVFDGARRNEIGIALRELIVNAVKHGNRYDAAKEVSVQTVVTDRYMEIAVRDSGSGFDPDALDRPDISKKLAREQRTGGWGFFVAVELADSWWVHSGERGTCVYVRFSRI